jgi:hypothetical protein
MLQYHGSPPVDAEDPPVAGLHLARFRVCVAVSFLALAMLLVADFPMSLSRHERVDASSATADV